MSLIRNICVLLREKAQFSASICFNAPFMQVWAKSHIKILVYIQPWPPNQNKDQKLLLTLLAWIEIRHQLKYENRQNCVTRSKQESIK